MTEIAERTTRGFTRSQAGALLAALLVALGVRVCMVARTEAIAQDAILYLYMGRGIQDMGLSATMVDYDYHPGYSMAVALAAWATGAEFPDGWVRAGQWVSVFMSLVTLSGLYVIARAAYGHRIGLLTALLVGLSGPYARISCDVLSDSTAAAMAVLSVALGLGAIKALRSGSGWTLLWAGGAGLAAGAGYLTRPEAILGGPVVVVLLLSARGLGVRGRAIQIGALAVLVVVALACVVPYATAVGGFTQKKSLSDLVLSGGSGPLLAVVDGGGAHAYLEAVRRGVDRLRASLGTPIAALALITWLTWAVRGIFRFRLPDASVIRPTWDGIIVMFLPAAVIVPLVISMEIAQGGRYISSRHMLLACLFLAPCTGAAVITLAEWTLALVGAMRLRQIPWVSVWGWSAGIVVALMFQAFPILHRGKGCFRQAGMAIRERFGGGKPVLTDDPRVALFARCPAYQLDTRSRLWLLLRPSVSASATALLSRAAMTHDGVGYVAVALSGKRRPKVLDELPPERFVSVGEFAGRGEEKVWVFQPR